MSDEDVEAAISVFQQFGVNAADLSGEDLRHAWRAIARRCHPDHGGDAAQMTDLNVAYQVLSRTLKLRVSTPPPNAKAETDEPARARPNNGAAGVYTPPPSGRQSDDAPRAARPEWLDTRSNERFGATAGIIRKQDYTDRNYIRKTIHERSRGERERFHVQAFDGTHFTGLVLGGSIPLLPEMARAVAELHHSERGVRAKAVVVRPLSRAPDNRWSLLLLGGDLLEIPLDPDPRSGNDPAFIDKLNRIINSATRTT